MSRKGPEVKVGMTLEERDARRLTNEMLLCKKCGVEQPIKHFSTGRGGKDKLHYIASECNKCQYKRKLKKHGHKTQSYNATQLFKEKHTIEGRAARLFYNARNRAKQSRRDIEFNITKDYVYKLLMPMTCAITNVKLELGENSTPYSPSIDRIDNNRGYVKGNIQIVAQMYNFCKNNYTDKVAIRFLKQIKV